MVRTGRWLSKLAGVAPVLGVCVVLSAPLIAADRNDPPRCLFSEQPAILILIDGDPVYRSVEGTDLQRIINTKPLIVRDTAGIHYLKVLDGWMEAYSLTGIWSASDGPSSGAEQAVQQARAAGTVDLLDTQTLDAGPAPTIFVSTDPAELIVTDGPLRFAAVAGTPLEYVENTTANVFREPTDHELYVWTSGRWFRSWQKDGPWEFVPSSELPADLLPFGQHALPAGHVYDRWRSPAP